MQIDIYKKNFDLFFQSEEIRKQIIQSAELLKSRKRIFFIGNGGSNAICSHMMEDYAKIANFQTFAFSDAALITCFANDYGYEHAMTEWLKIHFNAESDILIAVSSGGNSPNIINATAFVNAVGGKAITLSGFLSDNKLRKMGEINFWLDMPNYGIVECFHQVILHIILDTINETK